MSTRDQDILEAIRSLAKDDDALKKLESLLSELSSKVTGLENQLELLESAIRHDYDSILITELDLDRPGPRIVYVNEGFTRMTGYTKEEVLGKTPRLLQGPKTDRAVLDRLKRRLIEGQAFFGHTINYRKDGTEFINQWDIHPLMNEKGEVTHWVSYQRDVTEKRDSAKALFNTDFDELLKRKEEFTLKFVKEEGSNNFSCKYLNEAFEEITGLEKSLILDEGLDKVVHAEDLTLIESALDQAFSGKTITETCRYRSSSGDFISVLQSFKPVFDEKGNQVESVKSVAKLELKEI